MNGLRSALSSCLLLSFGCAAPRGAAVTTPEKVTQSPRADAAAERLEREPVKFLEDVAQRTQRLDEYELVFYRQERLGAFAPKLVPMEQIHASFRKKPFSVKFEWLKADSDYYDSVYVEGENDNKLLVRERKGFLGMPPQTRVVDVMTPVKFARSKNPITAFGLGRLMQESLVSFHDAALRDMLSTHYEGVVNLDPMNRPAHHLRIERPNVPGVQYTRQELYFDTETLLPAGTDLFLPDGKLDAKYRYSDVNTKVQLTDADFRLGSRS